VPVASKKVDQFFSRIEGLLLRVAVFLIFTLELLRFLWHEIKSLIQN
jgi:hypothetical protein